MTKADLSMRTTEELVERFVEIGLEQDDALLEDDYRRFNKLYEEKADILGELKSRPGDERRTLLALYDHKNAQVRLIAIEATLAVEPVAARNALEVLAASHEQPQTANARSSLRGLDDGTYRPT